MTATAPELKSARYRATFMEGLAAGKVDREQRLIQGYSVITEGEALGHGFWCDADFLEQVAAAGNRADRGVKVRFTHPGLCSDGLGTHLGRAVNFRKVGRKVLADLRFADSTRKAPEYQRDPAEYVLELAEEDPAAFGTSIVFWHDQKAEHDFRKKNSKYEEERGYAVFKSPDKQNKKNLPHARLARLDASDIVDSPAANPNGFFAAGEELAAVGEAALAYLTGLSEEVDQSAFGTLAPERVKTFFAEFLDRHGLSLTPTPPARQLSDVPAAREQTDAAANGPDAPAPKPTQAAAGAAQDLSPQLESPGMVPEPPARSAAERQPQLNKEEAMERLEELSKAFPDDPAFVLEMCKAGKSVEEAQAQFNDRKVKELEEKLATGKQELETALAEKDAAIAALKAENQGLKDQVLGGEQPLAHGVVSQNETLAQAVDAAMEKDTNLSYQQAVVKVSREHPELAKKEITGE